MRHMTNEELDRINALNGYPTNYSGLFPKAAYGPSPPSETERLTAEVASLREELGRLRKELGNKAGH